MEVNQGKLEQGFASRAAFQRIYSEEKWETEYKQYFSQDKAIRGHETISNYQNIKAKVENSRGSGTVEGRIVDDLEAKTSKTDSGRLNSPRKRAAGVSLDMIFQSDESLSLFLAFASARLVSEGIYFWNEVESFQNLSWKANRVLGIHRSKFSMKDHAQMIYDEFLSENAPSEVCVPGMVLQEIKKKLASQEDISKDLFQEAQRIVFRDLEKGLFREFLSSLNSKGLAIVNSTSRFRKGSAGLATANALNMTETMTVKKPTDTLPSIPKV